MVFCCVILWHYMASGCLLLSIGLWVVLCTVISVSVRLLSTLMICSTNRYGCCWCGDRRRARADWQEHWGCCGVRRQADGLLCQRTDYFSQCWFPSRLWMITQRLLSCWRGWLSICWFTTYLRYILSCSCCVTYWPAAHPREAHPPAAGGVPRPRWLQSPEDAGLHTADPIELSTVIFFG